MGVSRTPVLTFSQCTKCVNFGRSQRCVKCVILRGVTPTYGGVVVLQQHHEHRPHTVGMQPVYRQCTTGIQVLSVKRRIERLFIYCVVAILVGSISAALILVALSASAFGWLIFGRVNFGCVDPQRVVFSQLRPDPFRPRCFRPRCRIGFSAGLVSAALFWGAL